MDHLDLATGSINGLEALRRSHAEDVMLPILLQLVIIILAARLFAVLFRKLGQPGVVGEIAAGLILGPSLLGQFPAIHGLFHPSIPEVSPELAEQVFHWIFTSLSQLGLIFLLFLIGLEFDFKHLRWNGSAALSISLAGITLPFLLGIGLAWLLHGQEELGLPPGRSEPAPFLSFALFLGTALSITALPILGRMMMEMNITRTRVGVITITSGAVDDAMGWILLATVAAVVRAQFEPHDTLLMIGETVGFALVMVFVVRPLLCRWVRNLLQPDGSLGVNALAVVLVAILLCAIATSLIGIFAIFGAFFLGAVLSDEHAFRQAVTQRLRDFTTAFFLPIFFTYTGLRTDIHSLESWHLWLMCGLVLLAAVFGKFGGCALAARFSGFSPRESAIIGVLMNTRALMELIVINVGYDLGVLPRSVFCMLVLMALATTVMTTPLLLRLMRGTELEPYLQRSDLLGAKKMEDYFEADAEMAQASLLTSPSGRGAGGEGTR